MPQSIAPTAPNNFSTTDAATILERDRWHLHRYVRGTKHGRDVRYSLATILEALRKRGQVSAAALCQLMPCNLPQLYMIDALLGETLEAMPWLWGPKALAAVERFQRDPGAFLDRIGETLATWDAASTSDRGFAGWLDELEAAQGEAAEMADERRIARAEDEARRLPKRMAIRHNIPLMLEHRALRDEYLSGASTARKLAIVARQAEIYAICPAPNDSEAVAAWWAKRSLGRVTAA